MMTISIIVMLCPASHDAAVMTRGSSTGNMALLAVSVPYILLVRQGLHSWACADGLSNEDAWRTRTLLRSQSTSFAAAKRCVIERWICRCSAFLEDVAAADGWDPSSKQEEGHGRD
jgi:hypothetical protein